MSTPRLVDSFSVPKEVLDEFAEMAEEENIDPFAETASKRQIASRQSDYHSRRFNRQALDSGDAFKAAENGDEVEGGYKDAMRLQRLEKEEERVRRAIEEKEKQAREEGQAKMDLDRTPPRAELEEAQKELAAMQGTKRKRRWDVAEPEDSKENKENKVEYMNEDGNQNKMDMDSEEPGEHKNKDAQVDRDNENPDSNFFACIANDKDPPKDTKGLIALHQLLLSL